MAGEAVITSQLSFLRFLRVIRVARVFRVLRILRILRVYRVMQLGDSGVTHQSLVIAFTVTRTAVALPILSCQCAHCGGRRAQVTCIVFLAAAIFQLIEYQQNLTFLECA